MKDVLIFKAECKTCGVEFNDVAAAQEYMDNYCEKEGHKTVIEISRNENDQ